MDSMVGYKTPLYLKFGWCGARLDDVMNFIPARITWLLLSFLSLVIPKCSARKALRIGWRQHAILPGPNSGWSEAATAGGIQKRLLGPIWAKGALVTDVWLGDPGDPPMRVGFPVVDTLTGQTAAFVERLASGWRAVLALVIPAAVAMVLLAKPAVALILGIGHSTPDQTAATGEALAMFALAVGLVHSLGVRGLALSLSVAYSASALVGLAVLRRWFGRIGTPGTWAPLRRVAVASLVMGAAVLVVSNLSAASSGLGLLVRVVASFVAGGLAYGVVITFLGRRSAVARRLARRAPTSRGR